MYQPFTVALSYVRSWKNPPLSGQNLVLVRGCYHLNIPYNGRICDQQPSDTDKARYQKYRWKLHLSRNHPRKWSRRINLACHDERHGNRPLRNDTTDGVATMNRNRIRMNYQNDRVDTVVRKTNELLVAALASDE